MSVMKYKKKQRRLHTEKIIKNQILFNSKGDGGSQSRVKVKGTP
jgi:hypothetical protein